MKKHDRNINRHTHFARINYPPGLPITAKKSSIIEAIRNHPVCIITGATGSGKTTQIPKMCLDAGRGTRGLIGCTQPRRLAAVMAARRIATELGQEVGASVGYKIRFDHIMSAKQQIKIMTDGILLMEIQSDRRLSLYDTVIIDEAHERSLNIDFILGLLKTILPARRDLRVIITSATIDTERFSQFFGDAPVIEVSGKTYPVATHYFPAAPGWDDREDVTYIEMAVNAVEEIVYTMPDGDILIFLPTEADIRETCSLLEGRYEKEISILPLFARLSWPEQEKVFQKTLKRKIVVATNIAETSITIPEVRYVIDAGLARIKLYNPRTKTTSLPIKTISSSSALQRQGRAGRVQAGVCFRLYSEMDYQKMSPFSPPEILRSNLAEVILRMLYLNLGDIYSFPFIDPPNYRSIRDGIETLVELNAIEIGKHEFPDVKLDAAAKGQPNISLTPRGRLMARLPLDPRLARMIIEADREGCLKEVTVIAAALTIQDPRERPLDKEQESAEKHALFQNADSDFLSLLKIWDTYHKIKEETSKTGIKRFCRDHFLSFRRMAEWQDIFAQLTGILHDNGFKVRSYQGDGAELYDKIHKSILSGYLSQIGIKKEKNVYILARGREAMIFPGSGLYNKGGKWIVAAEIIETTKLYARRAARIESAWLLDLAGDLLRYAYHEPRWEEKRGEVIADEQVSLFGLVIIPRRMVSYGPIDPKEAATIFIRKALVERTGDISLPFLEHNQTMIERIKGWEDKVRRRDILVGDDRLVEFYEKRLSGVYNLKALKKVIRDQGDQFLRMEEKDLLAQLPEEEEIALYPDEVVLGGKKALLDYRFAPGRQNDGATLRIPLSLLADLPEKINDSLIPGLWRHKLWQLLKGLPKEHRKALFPLKETYRTILEEFDCPEGNLLHLLTRFIKERLHIAIPLSAWPLATLDEHLTLRLALIDHEGKELCAARDMAQLKADFFSSPDSDVLKKEKLAWERVGLNDWDFPDLPERIPLKREGGLAGYAFPALFVAKEDTIGIRLFSNPQEANISHLAGVVALYQVFLRADFERLRKHLKLSAAAKLWAEKFCGATLLLRGIAERTAQDLFAVNIRGAQDFLKHSQEKRPQILPAGQKLLQAVEPLLRAHFETAHVLSELKSSHRQDRPALAYLAELEEEMKELVPADFLLRYHQDNFSRLIRYLQAQAIRARRGLFHLEKSQAKARLVKEYSEMWKLFQSQICPDTKEEKKKAIEEFFWMIEEFKVSLFAQELKTLFPISQKRLDEMALRIKTTT